MMTPKNAPILAMLVLPLIKRLVWNYLALRMPLKKYAKLLQPLVIKDHAF